MMVVDNCVSICGVRSPSLRRFIILSGKVFGADLSVSKASTGENKVLTRKLMSVPVVGTNEEGAEGD